MVACDPRLDQLLADPLVRQMMASDGVQEGELRRLAGLLVSHDRLHAQVAAPSGYRRRADPCSAWAA